MPSWGGGLGAAGESASVPAASERCKSGENRDVFHLSAAGRLRSLELPAAWRMYGFCFPEVLRADYAGWCCSRQSGSQDAEKKPNPSPMRMWPGDFLPPRLWVPPLHLPNPPGPAAPLTIGVLRWVHKRIQKRCNYRVIPRKHLKFCRLLYPFFFLFLLDSFVPTADFCWRPSKLFSTILINEVVGRGGWGEIEAVKMKSEANNKLEWKHNPGHGDRWKGGLDKHKKPQGHVWVCQDECGNLDLCLHAWMENELLFSHWLENKKIG